MTTNISVYRCAKLYVPGGVIERGSLIVDGEGTIRAVGGEQLDIPAGAEVVDWGGCSVLPGFIDVHVHGGGGFHMMDATYEQVDGMSRFHARHGTTAFLATTTTAAIERIRAALRNAAAAMRRGVSGAELVGVHLEGPYINELRRGAQDRETIRLPDPAEMAQFMSDAEQTIRLVTLAPEVEGGMELVKWLVERGVTVSLGHSDATYEQALKAVRLGASHTTHHFNGMRPLHHREPGLAGAGLMLSGLTTELIADGIHVHPAAARLMFEVKGALGLCMITDAVGCAGLPDGVYGGVRMVGGEVRLLDGSSLAGSTLTQIRGLKNMMAFTGRKPEELLPSLTEVPARQAGIADRKGALAKGKDADFVVADEQFEIVATYVRGAAVYRA